jgi:hypothetical protein
VRLQLEAVFKHGSNHQLKLLRRESAAAAIGSSLNVVAIGIDPRRTSDDLQLPGRPFTSF